MDAKSQLSLSGPRVTEKLLTLIGPNQLGNFRVVLRALRHWAKLRGLYNNKFGFLGGINFAIIATFACQLYPDMAPSRMITKAMTLVAEWAWPNPMQVCDVFTANRALNRPWQNGGHMGPPQQNNTKKGLLPIITPAYPNSNSAISVSSMTRHILLQEFKKSSSQKQNYPIDWNAFFRPSQGFFSRFPVFITVYAGVEEDPWRSKQWTLFVESRIRKYCEQLENLRCFSVIFPFQVGFSQPGKEGACWFVGIDVGAVTQFQFDIGEPTHAFVQDCMNLARDPARSTLSVEVVKARDMKVKFPHVVKIQQLIQLDKFEVVIPPAPTMMAARPPVKEMKKRSSMFRSMLPSIS
jgi:poly(A) polymerase Pap1